MYTSATNIFIRNKAFKTALIYLAAAIFTALFGGVYEIFSHGVYSNFMIYAFAFPLVLGTVPFFLLGYAISGGFQKQIEETEGDKLLRFCPRPLSRYLYHCGIITLTVGSLLNGVLEIYGTSSPLLTAYWIAGPLLLLTGIILYVITLRTQRIPKKAHNF